MGKPVEQNLVTRGVIIFVNRLIEQKKIDTDREFCEKVDFAQSAFSQIRKKTRNAPDSLLDSVRKKYGMTVDSLIRLAQEEASIKKLESLPLMKGNLNEVISDMQKQIDTLKGTLSRVLEKLDMN